MDEGEAVLEPAFLVVVVSAIARRGAVRAYSGRRTTSGIADDAPPPPATAAEKCKLMGAAAFLSRQHGKDRDGHRQRNQCGQAPEIIRGNVHPDSSTPGVRLALTNCM
mmetsp:Transcript_11922/g.34929  ORF Transcript_11922/g.34929 Transcript_11922/m.34929 type:complete len:108 (-) Transcript_11922:44-367(-)